MLDSVKQLAGQALRVLRPAQRIPIVPANGSVHASHGARSCPRYEVIPGVSAVTVRFEVPGASPQATVLSWSPAHRTLTLCAALPGEPHRAWYAVVAFSDDIDGEKGSAVLKESTLTVRVPRRDVDTFTGLLERSLAFDAARPAPLLA